MSHATDAADQAAEAERLFLAALQDAPSDQWARLLASIASRDPSVADALHQAALNTISDPDEREWLRKCIEKVRAA